MSHIFTSLYVFFSLNCYCSHGNAVGNNSSCGYHVFSSLVSCELSVVAALTTTMDMYTLDFAFMTLGRGGQQTMSEIHVN